MTRSTIPASSLPLVLLLCLLPGLKASANPLDDARRGLAQAPRDLGGANAALSLALNGYNVAQHLVTQRKADLAQAIATLQNKERALGLAHDALVAAQRALAQASDKLGGLRADLAVKQSALAAAESSVTRLLDSNIVLYDMKWSIFIEYNSMAGSFNAWAELPDGLKVTSSAITAAFHGNVPLPEIEPAEMLATAFGFELDRQCTFDNVVANIYADAGSDAVVFTSTRGLSELLSPEHAADATVKAVISGGSTIEGSLDEVATGCLNELNSAYAFLQQSASSEADTLLGNLMDAMITGTKLDTPTVQIKPFVAQMNYTVKLTDGAQQLLKYIPALQQNPAPVGLTFSFPRPGFAIVVKSHPVPTRTALRAQIGTIKSLSPTALKAALPSASYQLLEPALTSGSVDPTALITASLETLFKNINYTSMTIDPVYPYCLDLRGTPVQTELERLAGLLKIGNQGEANLSRLSFNFHTGQVSIAIDLRAMDQTTLQKAITLAGKTVDDVSDDSVRTWKAAVAEVANARQQIDAEVKNVSSASDLVARRTGQMVAAHSAVTTAQSMLDRARGLWDDAVGAALHRADDLRNARKAVAQAQSRIGDLENLINRLSHVIPPISRPHPFPHLHF
jgi:hypothetical protein